MTVNELIEHLQDLERHGHGEREVRAIGYTGYFERVDPEDVAVKHREEYIHSGKIIETVVEIDP